MEWLMLLVLGAGGGAGAYAAQRVRVRREAQREERVELEQVRGVAEEDVTVFGEQLRRLGEELGDQQLDPAAREDYQVALDAYEHAKREVPRMARPDDISSLIDTLTTGRYALACVRARRSGEPVPERRIPCFFNPQHGPSVRSVMWTSARTGSRTVPACQRCAAQVAAREKPEVRTITVNGRRVPYWEAGSTFHPYSRGYFPEGQVSASALAWMYAAPGELYAGPGGFDGLSFGGHGGFDGGGVDGGGFDAGGGDGGGST